MNGRAPAALAEAHGSWFRRAGAIGGDALAMVAVIGAIPFAILALGLPIAGLLRLLLWIGGWF